MLVHLWWFECLCRASKDGAGLALGTVVLWILLAEISLMTNIFLGFDAITIYFEALTNMKH